MKVKKLKILAAVTATALMMSFASVSAFALPDDETSASQEEEDLEYVPADDDEDEEGEAPEDGEDDEETVDPDAELEGYESVTDPDEEENPDEPAAETTAPADTTYDPITEQTMYVGQSINVRVGPGTTYNIFGGLTAGDSVQVIGKNGDWYAVKFLGGTGFILGSLLSTTPVTTTTTAAPAATPAPVETPPPSEAEVIDPEPPVTAEPPATEPVPEETEPAPVITTEAADNDSDADAADDDDADGEEAAAAVNSSGMSGPTAFLIALGCAVMIFFLVGLLPIIIHRIHHNKLYQY